MSLFTCCLLFLLVCFVLGIHILSSGWVLRRWAWHRTHWTPTQILGEGSMTTESDVLIPEFLDAKLLIISPLKPRRLVLPWSTERCHDHLHKSLLLKLLHNDIFIHVKIQNKFQLYDIVYVHQKCYLSLQSLVSINCM